MSKASLTDEKNTTDLEASNKAQQLTMNQSEYQFFDQLILIGVPPKSMNSKSPSILSIFPSTQNYKKEEEFDKIIDFCFPCGFQGTLHEFNDSQFIFNEFPFFLCCSDGKKTYGACIQFYLPQNTNAYFATNNNRRSPFCLCLLSRHPFFSSHFQFLTYLTYVLCGKEKIPTAKTRREMLPLKGFCHSSLTLDERSPVVAVYPGIHTPLGIVDILISYYKKTIPNQNVPFSDPLSTDFPLIIPNHLSPNNCMKMISLDVLFSSLPVNSIVYLYTSVLLEQKIVFVSNDPHKFSLCTIALSSLVWPFEPLTAVLPVLPHNFLSFLEAPTPYIIGLDKSYIKSASSADVVVDLDQKLITIQERIPELPGASELITEITSILKDRAQEITPPCPHVCTFFALKRNPEYDRFISKCDKFIFPEKYLSMHPQKYIFTSSVVESIGDIFSTHISIPINNYIISCFVTESNGMEKPVTVLNKKLFLSIVDPSELEFYRKFFNTVVFQHYCKSASKAYEQIIGKFFPKSDFDKESKTDIENLIKCF
ncbi:uDENN domain containing protein [Histomonas meleagridis]|uniref:uDENN domain containing protein n=1 Tax=Histomonas meleagridis TaxID=135588 RepID=UPI003559380B|nr:uDENN domain containing protein [Histomonas meleagridis]KAH0803398.1 uDENN domain containing protein [Histomonas meleagridis]